MVMMMLGLGSHAEAAPWKENLAGEGGSNPKLDGGCQGCKCF
jgi:hypothetical protein